MEEGKEKKKSSLRPGSKSWERPTPRRANFAGPGLEAGEAAPGPSAPGRSRAGVGALELAGRGFGPRLRKGRAGWICGLTPSPPPQA